MIALLIVVSGAIVAWSRLRPVNPSNVNDAWTEDDPQAVIAESLVDHDPSLLAAAPIGADEASAKA